MLNNLLVRAAARRQHLDLNNRQVQPLPSALSIHTHPYLIPISSVSNPYSSLSYPYLIRAHPYHLIPI